MDNETMSQLNKTGELLNLIEYIWFTCCIQLLLMSQMNLLICWILHVLVAYDIVSSYIEHLVFVLNYP